MSENLILYKLIHFGLSQQSKHQDIAAILMLKKNELDLGYIEGWFRPGLDSIWKEILDNVS